MRTISTPGIGLADCGFRTVPNTRAPRSASNCAISRPMPEETPVTNVVLFFNEVCIYTCEFWFIAFKEFMVFSYLFRANAAVSRSERIADQRFSPSVLTTAHCADFQAGVSFSICFRPLAVIASSTSLPRPPATGLHQTVSLQGPEIPHERRAI